MSNRGSHQQTRTAAIASLLGLLALSMPLSAGAKDLGVEGSVYEITEPDMLTGIQHKLVHMQETGELSRQQKTITQRSITHMLRPQPVKGVTSLPQGMEPSTHSFDPSVIINRDIVDTKGHVIAEKGQSLNPLNESSFGETFVFIDGDSPSQVSWIKKKIEARGEYVKPLRVILTNGDVKATSEELGRRVYFDQRGYLCKHFSITHVPVVVFQPGTEKRLLVQEVKLG